jgi:VanZ family protein
MRHAGLSSMTNAATRALGWLAVLSIMVLSLVPGRARPHILPNSYEEHFAAYVVASALLAMAYPALRQRVWLGAMLCVGAASFEVAQLHIAGRTSSVVDLVASVAGVFAGVALSLVVGRVYERLSVRF